MSMNIENVDIEYRHYILNRDKSLPPFRFCVCDWPYLAKSLVHHGIDVNTMKVIKMYCGDVDFKTFIKDKDGIIAFWDECWDGGYKQFEGLYHVDTTKLKGGCYYGGFRGLTNVISSQNQHIKHFNNVKYCWYIPRNEQHANDLKTKKEFRKLNSIEPSNKKYCWDASYLYKFGPGTVKAIEDNGQEIMTRRMAFIVGEIDIFAKAVVDVSVKINPVSSISDLQDNIDKIIYLISSIINEQYSDVFKMQENRDFIIRTFANYLTNKDTGIGEYSDLHSYDMVYQMYKNMIEIGSMVMFSDKVIEMYRDQYGTK